jgi:hypothetical protein
MTIMAMTIKETSMTTETTMMTITEENAAKAANQPLFNGILVSNPPDSPLRNPPRA